MLAFLKWEMLCRGLDGNAQSWARCSKGTASIWMYKRECLIRSFVDVFTLIWGNIFTCQTKFTKIWQKLVRSYLFFTFNYVKSLPKVVRKTSPTELGVGTWKCSHIVSVFTTADGAHSIKNRRKKWFLLSAAVLAPHSCLHLTAFRKILKVKSCLDLKKKCS